MLAMTRAGPVGGRRPPSDGAEIMGPSLLLETFRAVRAWRARRQTEGRLAELDDRMLRDVGIERGDIPIVAERCRQEARDRARQEMAFVRPDGRRLARSA